MDRPNNLQDAEKLDKNSPGLSGSPLGHQNDNKLPPLGNDGIDGVSMNEKIDGISKITKDGVKEIRGPKFDEVDFDDKSEPEIKGKKRRVSTHRIGCSCRSCSCFGCFGMTLVLLLIVAIIYFRPPFILNLFKNFLNDGYTPPIMESISNTNAIDMFKQDLEDNQASLSEPQLRALASDALNTDNVYVDIEPNYLRLVSNLSDKDNPLWFIIELGQNTDGDLIMTRVGFNRVSAPRFLREAVLSGVFNTLNLTDIEGGDETNLFVKFLVDAEDNQIEFNKVRFDKDKLVIENL